MISLSTRSLIFNASIFKLIAKESRKYLFYQHKNSRAICVREYVITSTTKHLLSKCTKNKKDLFVIKTLSTFVQSQLSTEEVAEKTWRPRETQETSTEWETPEERESITSRRNPHREHNSEEWTPNAIKRYEPESEDISLSRPRLPKDIEVAIVPQDYPISKLTLDQSEILKEAICYSIENTPVGSYSPNFNGNSFHHGKLGLYCKRQEDRQWVAENVESWTDPVGLKVKMIDPAQYQTVLLYAPKVIETKHILARLIRQNPTLKVDTWTIIGQKVVPSGTESRKQNVSRLLVVMDVQQVECLRELEFRPFCGISRAYCLVIPKKDKAKELIPAESRSHTKEVDIIFENSQYTIKGI